MFMIYSVYLTGRNFYFKTMIQKNQQAPSRNINDLKNIRKFTTLPFIIKGIMTEEDAELAIEIGADALVVSNHGGRVMDEMPGTARVLHKISERVARRVPVLVDGGIRSGMDVFKMIALGADAVLVGRPIAISAVGGEVPGVKFLYNQYTNELKNTMNITGAESLKNISKDMLLKK